MKYDFTSILDRRGMDAIAVDPGTDPYGIAPKGKIREGFDIIPMWVADMNFATAPTITEAIIERAKHPAFGYFAPRKEYFDSIISWQTRRNGAEGLEAKHIGYQNGVLGGVISALKVLCSDGDNVLVHAPTYVGFLEEVGAVGYNLIGSELQKDADGVWRMDYEDMDRRLRKNHIHLAILCSPHNPCGRGWEQDELDEAMEIFCKNQCIVISDEIWSDILLNGHKHIPTQSISEDAKNRTIAVYAPSKTFNLAGLIGSYHIIYNDYLKDRMRNQSDMSHYNSMNVLSMHALIGAYKPEGHLWVDELCEVLSENVNDAVSFIQNEFDGVEVSKPEGTYMLFLHCEEWCRTHQKTIGDLLKAGTDVGVAWQDGRPFYDPWGIRMNLALPFFRVKEAFDRLNRYVFRPGAAEG